MLRITVRSDEAKAKLDALQAAFASDGAFREPLERAAWRVHRDLVQLTRKRTGITRRQWSVSSPRGDKNSIRVHNDSKVMLWLERGTGWAGTPTSHGGRIYPKSKKFLYIPLRHGAMVWRPGLKFGKDFVLARSVRGITAMNIVDKYRPFAGYILKAEMVAFLERYVK